MKRWLFIFFSLALATAGCGASQSNHEGGVEGGTDAAKDRTIPKDGRVEGSGDGGDGPGDVEVTDSPVNDGPSDAQNDSSKEGGPDAMCRSPSDAGDAGALNWAKRFGITGTTDSTSVALDPTSGDVALTGYFFGDVSFGGGDLSGGDAGGGGFLARFNSAGSYKWAKSIPNNVEPYGVAVDNSGNVVMGGNFSGTADFGGGSIASTGDTDIFLAKYTSTGTFVWLKHFGVAAQSSFFSQALFDSSGNLYLAAEAGITALNVGCGALPAGSTYFVAEFDSTGACVWSHAPTVTDTTEMKIALSLDSTGNVLVAGGFYGTINFGGGPLAAPGADLDAFVAKFSSSGALVWAKAYDSGSWAQATGVGTDPCGDIWVAGGFQGTLNLGAGAMTNSSGAVMLAKLDGSGFGVWSTQFVCPPSSSCGGADLAVDPIGEPVIGGAFSNSIDFGGGTLLGSGPPYSSMYIAKFDSAGAYKWAYAGGPPTSTSTNSAGEAIAAAGAAVVGTGVFQGGTLSLAGTTLTAVSAQDMYLASFMP